MKILVIGNLAVNYRSDTFISYLIERNIRFQWLDENYCLITKNKYNIYFKIFRKVSNKILYMTYHLLEFFFILRSDVIFILPMNHKSIIRILIIKLFKKKLIVDFYVSLYDSFILDRMFYSKNSFKAYKYKLADKFAILFSDKIIFLNKNEKKYYLNLININLKKSKEQIIPLYIPSRPKGELPFFNKNSKMPVICWWGSFLNLHGVDKIIDSIGILHNENFLAKFYLFGMNNPKYYFYENLINKKKLNNYIILRNDLTFKNGLIDFLINNCDLALGNFGDNSKAQNVLLNKILDAIAMEIPVLTMKNNAVFEFFDENSIFTCENNPNAIAKNIIKIFKDPEKVKNVTQNAKKIYNNNFTKEKFYKNLNGLLNSLD